MIDESVLLGVNNNINENSIINKDTVIGNNNTVIDSMIGSNCTITDSYIEYSNIGNGVSVGPYAHIKAHSSIGDNVVIGNYVEIKNSTIGKGTKIKHLSYVGDATIGENCNIGCGVIFVNYSGREKNKITIGNNCFIGSNVNLIAPLNIEDDCYICAGATVTKNLKKGDFVIGRVREDIKPNRAYDYLKN